MNTATLTRKRTYADISVDVEVDITDLVEAGWHHEDECPSKQPAAVSADHRLRDAVDSLHRQAHPAEHQDPVLCREEPCRSLTISQIRGA